jgi:CheY-like chemotaxis protein
MPSAASGALTRTTARILDAVTAELEAVSGRSSAPMLETSRAEQDPAGRRGVRILLVEDHHGIAKACQRLLEAHGHLVVRAPTIATAVAAVERYTFDALICDLRLPDGNGLELLPRIGPRLKRRGGKLPALAISGSVYEDDVARCLEAGFAAHLAKPFEEQNLIAALQRVLS